MYTTSLVLELFYQSNNPSTVVQHMKNLFIVLLLTLYSGCTLEYVLTEDEAFFIDAKHSFENDYFNEAITEFTSIITNYPWSSRIDDSYYYLGLSHLGLAETNDVLGAPEHVSEALNSFTAVLENSNHFVDALFEIGYSFYLLQEYDSTLAYCKKILLNFPMSTKADNATIYTGHYYRKTNDADSSIIWYEKTISDFKESSSYDNALYWAGDYYYDHQSVNGNREKAIDYLSQFCNIADQSDDKYSKAVTKLSNMGED